MEFGVPAEVRAGLDDLYRSLGSAVVDALAELSDRRCIAPAELLPEHLEHIRPILGERFLRAHHAEWKRGQPTPAFWRDRSLEGRATGLAVPLGDLEDGGNAFMARVAAASREAAGPNQPPPRGLVVMSKNAHFGNRPGVISYDLIPADLDEALAVNRAVGQQHTLPGSIGEASGTTSSESGLALLWEVQPNIYKPSGDRNRNAASSFRRHRNWHVATAVAALAWLEENDYRIFVLRGSALRVTHQVNQAKPVTSDIERMHDRTVGAAARTLGLSLEAFVAKEFQEELRALANVALTKEIDGVGIAELVWEARRSGGLERRAGGGGGISGSE